MILEGLTDVSGIAGLPRRAWQALQDVSSLNFHLKIRHRPVYRPSITRFNVALGRITSTTLFRSGR